MKPYYRLTNQGQARRLRRLARSALESYDLDVERLRLITNDLNGIFRVDTRGSHSYALRVSIPGVLGHTLPQIRSEMAWLAALAHDTDLGVPHPLPARDGSLVTTAGAPGVPEPRHCAIFSWLPGPTLSRQLSPANLAKLGELAARLHTHAATFVPPEGFAVPTADSVFPFREPVVLFNPEHAALFPSGRRRVYEDGIARIQATLNSLYAGGQPPRVLHYDLHQWNVKVYRGRLSVFDFEDLMFGHPAQDIAITFYYFQDREDYASLREAFQNGYTRHLAWPERFAGEIDAYVAGRGVELTNFVLQDPDPRYQAQRHRFVERMEGRFRAFLAGPGM
ncbi:MAG TPA: phosphotransferase [Anaerolineae bacterium]|nr:phosphotransferase [Anaerolineae bacterium]